MNEKIIVFDLNLRVNLENPKMQITRKLKTEQFFSFNKFDICDLSYKHVVYGFAILNIMKGLRNFKFRMSFFVTFFMNKIHCKIGIKVQQLTQSNKHIINRHRLLYSNLNYYVNCKNAEI